MRLIHVNNNTDMFLITNMHTNVNIISAKKIFSASKKNKIEETTNIANKVTIAIKFFSIFLKFNPIQRCVNSTIAIDIQLSLSMSYKKALPLLNTTGLLPIKKTLQTITIMCLSIKFNIFIWL